MTLKIGHNASFGYPLFSYSIEESVIEEERLIRKAYTFVVKSKASKRTDTVIQYSKKIPPDQIKHFNPNPYVNSLKSNFNKWLKGIILSKMSFSVFGVMLTISDYNYESKSLTGRLINPDIKIYLGGNGIFDHNSDTVVIDLVDISLTEKLVLTFYDNDELVVIGEVAYFRDQCLGRISLDEFESAGDMFEYILSQCKEISNKDLSEVNYININGDRI